MKTILRFLIVFGLVLAPYKIVWDAPEAHHGKQFPWATYEQAGPYVMDVQPYLSCKVPANVVLFIVGPDQYQSLNTEDKDIFVHMSESGPDHVWLTKGTEESSITIVREMEWPDFQKRYPDPCGYFEELET